MGDLRDLVHALLSDDRIAVDCCHTTRTARAQHPVTTPANTYELDDLERIVDQLTTGTKVSTVFLPASSYGRLTRWGDTLAERSWRSGLLPGVTKQLSARATPHDLLQPLRELVNLGAALLLLNIPTGTITQMVKAAALAQEVGLLPVLAPGVGIRTGTNGSTLWEQLALFGADDGACLLLQRHEQHEGHLRNRLIGRDGHGPGLLSLDSYELSVSQTLDATTTAVTA